MKPTTGWMRGNPVVWSSEKRAWIWPDSGEIAEYDEQSTRPCVQCGRMPEPRGIDPCFAHAIEGASGACCGHGIHLGYVNWRNVPVNDETPGNRWLCGIYVGPVYPKGE